MRATVLMDASQNPKKRALILDANTLYVMSECCSADIEESKFISVIRKGSQVEEEWAMCSRCHRTLEHNDTGWTSSPTVWSINGTTPSSWRGWGKYWFGLEDFAMEVAE